MKAYKRVNRKKGKTPNDWRNVEIVPIFKKGSRKQYKNCRQANLQKKKIILHWGAVDYSYATGG